jgi:hypothetical protein
LTRVAINASVVGQNQAHVSANRLKRAEVLKLDGFESSSA